MLATVRKINTAHARRVIAVSDVHGNGAALKALLNKISFSHDDMLILLGDHIEKGCDSLGTMRYIMQLSREYEVYSLMGNCDTLWEDVLSKKYSDNMFHYMSWRKHSILNEMCAAQGIAITPDASHDAVTERLGNEYEDIFAFLREQPYIIDSDVATYVHAGLTPGALDAQDAETCVRQDAYFEFAKAQTKTLIVGHMPVMNYCAMTGEIPFCKPIFDDARKLISIDGGNSIKEYGQLNAFIYDNATGEYSWDFVDDLSPAVACGSQAATKEPVSVVWIHNSVERLAEHDGLVTCRVLHTGKTLDIPAELVLEKNGQPYAYDYTNYFHEIRPGDRIGLVKKGKNRSLVKKDGLIGWVENSVFTDA